MRKGEKTMLLQALIKLDKEVETFTGGQMEQAVYRPVALALKSFCRQDEEFAQAIVQNDKTLSDCCKEIMAKAGDAISDIDVYRKAVQFYFSGAEIEMNMSIKVNPMQEASGMKDLFNLSLDDLLDD